MSETHAMDNSERYAIIAGIIGSFFAILVIITIGIHMGIYLRNKQKNRVRSVSVYASNQQNDGLNKYIYILGYITLCLFILTPISQTFMRSNFVLGSSFDPHTICFFSYFMYYFPYSMGQFTLSTLFLYRLHMTFYKSQYKISRRTNMAIASIFGICSLLFVCILLFSKKIFVNITTLDGKYKYCTNENGDTLNYIGWLGGYGIQTLYNIYVLYAFIWRLYKIRKSMMNSFVSERSKKAEPSNADITRYKRILKLNRVMIKMCFLVILSILFTWVYLFVGIVDVNIAFAVSYSILLDTICMWLLFSSVSQKYWDILVNIFYFPCFCYKLCPSIKNDEKSDIKHLKSHADLSDQTLKSNSTQNNNDAEMNDFA